MFVVITTVGLPKEGQVDAIRRALYCTLANAGVHELIVMTEAATDWLDQLDLPHRDKLKIEPLEDRPTFRHLFERGNLALDEGAGAFAVTNADVAFAAPEDVDRALSALRITHQEYQHAVLALTRWEWRGGDPRITLFDDNGVSNAMSADAWVACRRLELKQHFNYYSGQMNCDLVLACDLAESGVYTVNPCLSVTLVHFEPEKSKAYYAGLNAEEAGVGLYDQHKQQTGLDDWFYPQTPWVSLESLRIGHFPQPVKVYARRFVIPIVDIRHDFANRIEHILELSERYETPIEILTNKRPHELLALLNPGQIARLSRLYFSLVVDNPLEAALRYATGGAKSLTSSIWLPSLDQLTWEIVQTFDCVVIGAGESRAPAVGCTLVTSVFRSDDFLESFCVNTETLRGFGNSIEHVLVFADLSDLEREKLMNYARRHSNVVLIWFRFDPGLYECWNVGIRVARTKYVSNANVDDLRHPTHVLELVRALELRQDCQVAASGLTPFHEIMTPGQKPTPGEVWYADQHGRFGYTDLARVVERADGLGLDPHNLPHCMPVWRKSLHESYGFFNEEDFGTFADWAFWLDVLRDGHAGWLDGRGLGFYFINPASHNRRGDRLAELHRKVEARHAETFAFSLQQEADPEILKSHVPKKLKLDGLASAYGQHRNAFSRLIGALAPLDRGEGGVRLIPFVEKYFVWGEDQGEAGSEGPRPITEPWIGIVHVPFDAPDWFDPKVSPENFMVGDLFQESLPACRGLVALSDDLAADVARILPGVEVCSAFHPTELEVEKFSFHRYIAFPRVVQVGDWLRKLRAIYSVADPVHERIILKKKFTSDFLEREAGVLGAYDTDGVSELDYVSDEEYDALLASSVVLCLLYETAANNAVVECLARGTPIIVSPLAAVVEYLGPDYPLYASTPEEAQALLAKPARIKRAAEYLDARRKQVDLSYDGFFKTIANSALYRRLKV